MSAELGKQFDPVVLSALLDNWDEFVELFRRKKASEAGAGEAAAVPAE